MVALLGAALLGSACARAAPPGFAPLRAAAFPFAVDSLRTQSLGSGERRHFIYSSTGPWAIHVLEVALDGCHAPIAVKGGNSAIGRTKTSELLRALAPARDLVGGVNADFFLFNPAGVPTGAHVSAGRVITPPSAQPVFAVDSAGRLRIAVLIRRTADSLVVDDRRLATLSLLPFHPIEAVGGRPVLARDSIVGEQVDTEGQAGFATARHPRTAVGIADGGRRLLLVVVDGRQRPYSDGMSLRELANLMLALGARDALNLDGGGSTAMVFADPDSARALRLANRPSDPTGERPVGNALAVARTCERR